MKNKFGGPVLIGVFSDPNVAVKVAVMKNLVAVKGPKVAVVLG